MLRRVSLQAVSEAELLRRLAAQTWSAGRRAAPRRPTLLSDLCYCQSMGTLKYDLTGQTFGLLTAVSHAGSGDWLVRCECGTEKVLMGQNLRTGKVRSCGCAYRRPGRQAGRGATHPRWVGDEITYVSAHRRVTAARGPAREHPCIDCGKSATSWSYRGNSPRERTQQAGPGHRWKAADELLRFSPDPDDYDPMCWACHARRDLAQAAERP